LIIIFLQCGGGYDILLLLNDAPLPEDISKIPRITVSTCIATRRQGNFVEQNPEDEYGAICPSDSLHEQALGEQHPTTDCRVYLETTTTDTFGVMGGTLANKRIIRCQVDDAWVLLRFSVDDVDEEHAHVFETTSDSDKPRKAGRADKADRSQAKEKAAANDNQVEKRDGK